MPPSQILRFALNNNDCLKLEDTSMKRCHTRKHQTRRGAITVLTAFMSIMLVGMVAFSVDIGYLLSAKEELQRSADSSALAACSEYEMRVAKGSVS